jgi:glycosyltransferase involved in cell wall biosynthesis
MPRTILPAFAAMLALRHGKALLVFDADGLPLDERVDFAGASPSGFAYRLQQDMESEAVRRAKVVLTRSKRATDVLLARAGAGTNPSKFHVVSNGRDSALFAPADDFSIETVREELDIPQEAPLLVYAGSLGAQYCLDGMLHFFTLVRAHRPDSYFLILTPHLDIVDQTMSFLPELADFVKHLSVPTPSVPKYLASADLGLALRRPSFSMQAVAPIKLGEYLLCGVPVVATAGIGDTEEMLETDVAFLLGDCDSAAELTTAAHWFVDQVLVTPSAYRKRCRAFGVKHFSLDATVTRYRRALRAALIGDAKIEAGRR